MVVNTVLGSINKSADFDKLSNGFYYINTWGGSDGNNCPPAQGIGFLLQIGTNDGAIQFAFYANGTYCGRINSQGTWGEWDYKKD